ncbi:MAG: hypothetical protein ACAI34_03860, partial [Verrucomicrobium sp.]|nr:hypothetical protein [Verrucomicrobium sp.]
MYLRLRYATTLLLALSAALAAGGDDSPRPKAVVSTLSSLIDGSGRTTFLPCPGDPQIVAAYR